MITDTTDLDIPLIKHLNACTMVALWSVIIFILKKKTSNRYNYIKVEKIGIKN